MFSIGFIAGGFICGAVALIVGRFARIDSMVSHERADITPALRRSSR